jgi:N-acetylglutamate synthase-like GNAT family acetyltransferase
MGPMPNSTIIRAARRDDAPTLRRMVRAAGLDPTSLHWENFLVAEREGRAIGIGQVKPYRGAPELGSLVVLKTYRGQGVGASLIHALIERHPGELFLFCRDRLEGYYAQFGFERAGLRELRGTVKHKYLFARLFRLFGVKIIAMRRSG